MTKPQLELPEVLAHKHFLQKDRSETFAEADLQAWISNLLLEFSPAHVATFFKFTPHRTIYNSNAGLEGREGGGVKKMIPKNNKI